MYTIKRAASRAGVSVPLVRAWERRYGIVDPARTEAGYRLYDDASIARLRAMRRLVDDGWSPSAAATTLRTADDEAVRTIVGGPAAAAEPAARGDDLADRFVSAAADLDEPRVEAVLDEMFARGTFEHVVADLVMPALVALGDAWAAGRVDVAAEHAASHAVLRRLGTAFAAAGRPPHERDVVLVGLPPGSRHELGALAFGIAARRAGLPLVYLGADLPVQDWIEAAAHTTARGAVIGVVTRADVDPARRVAAALHAARPSLVIAFGGRSAPKGSARDGAIRLPVELPSAVDALRTELEQARAGRADR
jgi:MerR family transcriptional regulator, light-induced transcriptional regulator